MSEVVQKIVNLGEYSLKFAIAGEGPPLLLLHGSEHGEHWRVWEPMLGLSDNHRLIMPDLIGYGASSKPNEIPDHTVQANVLRDLLENLRFSTVTLIGSGWGGQIAIELALQSPDMVDSLVLIASSYDKEQLPRLRNLEKPTLIVWAEDDLVTQLKAGYLLRDAIRTSRLEVLSPVAKDPRYDFRIAHNLERFRTKETTELIRRFLADPRNSVLQPPEMENELRGLALRKDEKGENRGSELKG